MTGWLAAILGFFKALPELLKLFKTVWGFLADLKDKQTTKAIIKDVNSAFDIAQKTGNTQALNDLFATARAKRERRV